MKSTFYEILEEIRKRPTFFYIEKVEDFYIFFGGIRAGSQMIIQDIEDEDYKDFTGFDKWVRNHYRDSYNPVLNVSWIRLIRFHSLNNEQSLRIFFNLLNGFKNRKKSILKIEDK